MPNHYLKQKQFHIRQLSVASFVDIMITKAQEKKNPVRATDIILEYHCQY